MFYLKSPNKKWWRWEIRAVDIQPSTKTRIVSGKKWDFLWLFWRIWTDITHELKSSHSKTKKNMTLTYTHGQPMYSKAPDLNMNLRSSLWAAGKCSKIPWAVSPSKARLHMQSTTMFSILGLAGRLCNLNKKERWIVVRLIKFQILWGELNAIRVLAEMEKLEKDTGDGANQDRSRVRGTWRHSCKSIHLRNFWTPKFLTLPIPQIATCHGVRNVVRHHRTVVIQIASDLIRMLNKCELYVSWSPFWWKTRWLHRSRACSETWELNGVQKHQLSILPCSNCFPMFPSIGRMRLIHIARHIPLVLWWTTVSWMCKLWEFLCFYVFLCSKFWFIDQLLEAKSFTMDAAWPFYHCLQEIHKCHGPEMPPVLHIKNCLMKNNPGHVAIIHHVNNVAIHKLARELLDESNGTSFVSSVTQRPVVAPVWLDDEVEIASNLGPSRIFVTYHNVLRSHYLNTSDQDRLTL